MNIEMRYGTEEELCCGHVDVYRNLTKGCWSIRARRGKYKGKVVAHADMLNLWECFFHVSEAGRQRVLSEKKKTVHAWVTGMFHQGGCGGILPDHAAWTLEGMKYNPYKQEVFTTLEGSPRKVAKRVTFGPEGQLVALRLRATKKGTRKK